MLCLRIYAFYIINGEFIELNFTYFALFAQSRYQHYIFSIHPT